MKLSRIFFMLLVLFGFICFISSTVGVAWGKDTARSQELNTTQTIYIGLWKFCRGSECNTYNEATVQGWWYAIRVEMILAVMISFTGFILSIAMIAKNTMRGYYLSILLSPAVLLSIIGISTWTSKINQPYVVSYSCVLGWIGVALLVIASIASALEDLFAKPKKSEAGGNLI